MKIKCLVENTTIDENLTAEHGLSIYVETDKHKLLFDTGSTGVFAENAKKMGVKLEEVDTVIISHGHYDHTGGIKTFLEINKKAPIYIRENAFSQLYHVDDEKCRYIGIHDILPDNDRIHLVKGDLKLDEELSLFTNVTGRRAYPLTNAVLKQKVGDEFIQDDFLHEQNLVITQGNKKYMICGCSHNGIVNIVDKYHEIYDGGLCNVFGGFHTLRKSGMTEEDEKIVDEISKELLKNDTIFYTCHCTGVQVYDKLKCSMKDKVEYLSTGAELEFN